MGRRRRSFAVTNLLSDIIDDIKDFLDDEILDRTRGTERDVRRAGRNLTDRDRLDAASTSGAQRNTQRNSADLDELRGAIHSLAEAVSKLDAAPATAKPATKTAAKAGSAKSVVADPVELVTAAVADPDHPAKTMANDPVAVLQVAAEDPAAMAKAAAADPEALAKIAAADKKATAKVAAADKKATAKVAAANPKAAAAVATAGPKTAAKIAPTSKPAKSSGTPWPGYDEQTVVQIRKDLAGADATKVRAVLSYEAANKNRRGVLTAAEAALDT